MACKHKTEIGRILTRPLKSVVSYSHISLKIIMKSICAVDEGQMTQVV